MAKQRLRIKRVAAALVLVCGVITCADHIRRDLFHKDSNNIVVSEDFKDGKEKTETPTMGDNKPLNNDLQTTTAFEGIEDLGYSELSIPSSYMTTGALAVFTEANPAEPANGSGLESLSKKKNEYYTLVSESVKLNADALDAFNRMMEDYHVATGLADFIVYGTTDTYTDEGSCCPEYFPESACGNTVDLALSAYGGIINFDGKDAESWVLDNCASYGFVLRYPKGKKDKTSHDYCPWHLRYVGPVHSSIMKENGLCLEEYLDFLKEHTFDKALEYSLDGVNYKIYSVESMGDSTSTRVPISGNYTISGTNTGWYIITTVKN